MIEVKKVSSKKELKKFIDFPHNLYVGDENYVPELYLAQKDLLNKKKHPFFKHSNAECFLAYRNNTIVGRIAAIKNNNYINYTENNTGYFGFFESIEDYSVAEALLDQATSWVRNEGMEGIMGPANFSTNETCGTLIEGFDRPPTIMMTYNKSYYPSFFEKYGLEKDVDLLSYIIYTKDIPDKLSSLSSRILQRLNQRGITIRTINMKNFEADVRAILKVYNAAWEENMGFVPMTEEEFLHAAKDIKTIIDPDFLLIAEHNGQTIGFSLIIPDMNVALRKLRKGRLLPFGLLKLLYYKNKIDRVRVITLGVIQEYRKLGIDAYFYMKAFELAKNKKMLYGEASWILENNEMMNKALTNINGQVYKKHRIYKKSI